MKMSQEAFQKKTNDKFNDLLEKVNQLITPDNSYWKVNFDFC